MVNKHKKKVTEKRKKSNTSESPKKKVKQNSKDAVTKAKAQLENAVNEANAQLTKAVNEEQKSNPPSKTVFVGNLPTTITDQQLTKYFKECGNVVNIYRMSQKTVKRGNVVRSFNGKVIIGFETIKQAAIAVAKHGEDCFGQNIVTNFVKPREPRSNATSIKKKKKKKNLRVVIQYMLVIYDSRQPTTQ